MPRKKSTTKASQDQPYSWSIIKEELKKIIPTHSYRMWIEPITGNIISNKLILNCENPLTAKEIQKNYYELIRSKFNGEVKINYNDSFDRNIQTRKEVEQHISKVQENFSFIPTPLTRTSPFFIISKKDMKNRPFEKIEFESNWGYISIEGRKLSIKDEDNLLVILCLALKNGNLAFTTTKSEVCSMAQVSRGANTYNALWESIKRLTGTRIDMDLYVGKGQNRIIKKQLTGTILKRGELDEDGKLNIEINEYFWTMYAESFITKVDLHLRSSLKGDVTKALHRFFEGQKDIKYGPIHIITIANAINLEVPEKETKETLNIIRKRLREGLRELRTKRYLNKWMISTKGNTLIAWKNSNYVTTY